MQREAILTVNGQEILNFGRQSVPTFAPGHRLNSGPFGTMGGGAAVCGRRQGRQASGTRVRPTPVDHARWAFMRQRDLPISRSIAASIITGRVTPAPILREIVTRMGEAVRRR